MAERTVDIRDNAHAPKAEPVTESREQIMAWLDATSPIEVHDRGMTYERVASAVRSVAEALPDVGTTLSGAWRSANSAQAQRALQMLNASGLQLADAMDKMSRALTLYGRDYLPEAIEAVRSAPGEGSEATPEPSPGPAPTASESPEPTTPPVLRPQTTHGWGEPTAGASPQASEVDDEAARRALEKLNRYIVDLYDFTIPDSVTVNLPDVTPASGPAPEREMPLGTQTPYQQGGDGSGGSSGGTGAGSSGSAGSSGQGGSTGSAGSSGSDGSSGSSGSDGSSGPDSDDRPDPEDSSDTPGASDPPADQQAPPDQDTPSEQGDGAESTTPPVIDNSTTDPGQTTQTGAETTDPRATETAGTQPTVMQQPTTQPPVTTPTTGYPASAGGTPAVIGGTGAYSQTGTPGAAAAAAARGGMGGMGLFPPMGGGTAEEEQEYQRTVYLAGSRDDWPSGEGATSPTIGGS
ncbi:hypothetical protein GCM10022224_101350 [Nonomuraea antimicrobica]|uniref:PPE family protein n=1 Tax=Nonomuraea antimicrobica TaxID=561173 RepID=A0ABP7EHD3_9ACTN